MTITEENKIELTEEENNNIGRFIELFRFMMQVQQFSESLHKTVMTYVDTFEKKEIILIKKDPINLGVAQIKINFSGILNNLDYLNEELDKIEKELKEGVELFQKLHPPVMPNIFNQSEDKKEEHSGIILPN